MPIELRQPASPDTEFMTGKCLNFKRSLLQADVQDVPLFCFRWGPACKMVASCENFEFLQMCPTYLDLNSKVDV